MNDIIREDLNQFDTIKAEAISAFNKDEFEKTLNYIQVAAGIAWKRPIGLWHDEILKIY